LNDVIRCREKYSQVRGGRSLGGLSMADQFPVGHRYRVDFQAFKVELFFESETSLTFFGVDANGNVSANGTPVAIKVIPIRDMLFLVTWQEGQNATIVHLEDFKNMTIITNITDHNLRFRQFKGDMTLIS
jgi:hypothetical protein